MGIIRVLPEAVANKIAAGEVIERPASVVKELVENALDAQASAVEIDIQHGGKSLIRISDNGIGMTRQDAELAFARHATSKITAEKDLLRVRSFGFRGEALPSIAAVSRTHLVTGTPSGKTGTEIKIDGGVVSSITDSAPRQGTLIEVRDLFFNTPARRKFLRADTTEMGHILDVVSHLAFSSLSVRFLLRSGNRVIFDLVKVKEPMTRALAIFGAEVAKHLLPVEGKSDGVHIHGLVGKPFVARANRMGQRFFINGRWIRSTSLGYALQEGYDGLLMHGQYPLAVLFIDVDPERVDVNVHPTKQEVRLSNEAPLKNFLKEIVAERMRKEPDLAPYILERLSRESRFSTGRSTSASIVPPHPATIASPPVGEARVFTVSAQLGDRPGLQPAALLSAHSDPLRSRLRIIRILGQVHQWFILAETEDGFLIVDQHAAHERILFEALLNNFERGHAEKQSLLVDTVLEVHPRQSELLVQSLPLLAKVGFELEPFGEAAYVIRSYPAILGNQDPVNFLANFLDERESGKLRTELDRTKEQIAALIACKRQSVRAREGLATEAVQALLTRLAACDNPFSCPHGRPTIIRHTVAELERLFKRT